MIHQPAPVDPWSTGQRHIGEPQRAKHLITRQSSIIYTAVIASVGRVRYCGGLR